MVLLALLGGRNVPVASLLERPLVDITAQSFNPCGIDTGQFIKIALEDMDGDGRPDLILGDKSGKLSLYTSTDYQHWQLRPGYFAGIAAGALAAPAVGDLDGDGQPEVVVGTGGFSTDSGRVLIYRNEGSRASPRWVPVPDVAIDVGDDAAPAVADLDFDGRPDLIVGNSEGRLAFFRNKGNFKFQRQDLPWPLSRGFGMYATPAAVRRGNTLILAVGNSMGRLSFFEIAPTSQGPKVTELAVNAPVRMFVSLSFASLLQTDRVDLILADGDGRLEYFVQQGARFSAWAKHPTLFQNRLRPGPASAPALFRRDGQTWLVVGNIDGLLQMFQARPGVGEVPWVEQRAYLPGIRVSSFARGVLADWQGRELLVVGQSDGSLRAFGSVASAGAHVWREFPLFFQGIRVKGNSAPCLFDLDGDGQWELICGALDGRLYVYRVKALSGGLPVWEPGPGVLDRIRVAGYATPTMAADAAGVYLLVGQQDGRIRAFFAERRAAGLGPFTEMPGWPGLEPHPFASPSLLIQDGRIDLVVGDYDGNLRHFVSR